MFCLLFCSSCLPLVSTPAWERFCSLGDVFFPPLFFFFFFFCFSPHMSVMWGNSTPPDNVNKMFPPFFFFFFFDARKSKAGEAFLIFFIFGIIMFFFVFLFLLFTTDVGYCGRKVPLPHNVNVSPPPLPRSVTFFQGWRHLLSTLSLKKSFPEKRKPPKQVKFSEDCNDLSDFFFTLLQN